MNALNAICNAVRHMTAKPRTGPVPCWETPAPSIPLKPTPRALCVNKQQVMKHHQSSPLASDNTMAPQLVDLIDTAYSNPAVIRYANVLIDQRSRFADIVQHHGAVAEAINELLDRDDVKVGSIDAAEMAAKVVSVLSRLSDEVQHEVTTFRMEQARHVSRHQARMQRLSPLNTAVRAKQDALTAEVNGLILRVQATRRAGGFSTSDNRYRGLLAAGFDHAEIAGLDVQVPVDHVRFAQSMEDRIIGLRGQLQPLEKFLADPLFSPEHLAGQGFDELISARQVAEQEHV